MRKIIVTLALFAFSTSLLFAQTETKDKDAKVTIRTKNGTKTIENWGEDLGDLISASILKLFDIDESESNVSINISTDEDWDAFGERMEELATEFTEGLEIEMRDLEPDEFEDDSINGFTMEDWFDEIARSEGSEVKHVEKLLIRLQGDEGIKLNLKALLENGKVVKHERLIRD